MNIEMSGVTVGEGTSGPFFNNDRGVLNVRGLEVNGVNSTSVLSTANGGVSFLQDSTITNSTLGSVTFTTNGGAQTVTGTTVTGLNRLGTAFSADGEGTSLVLTDVDVVDNLLERQEWVGIAGFNGATIRGNDVNITLNDGLLHGVQTGSLATATVSDSFISGNTSPLLETSAAIFTVNSTAVVERTIFDQNQGFTVSHTMDSFSTYMQILILLFRELCSLS